MEKIARKYREDTSNVTNANRRADKQPVDEILHYFFGDASYALISRTDSRYVVPFFAKSREARIYSAKVLRMHMFHLLAIHLRNCAPLYLIHANTTILPGKYIIACAHLHHCVYHLIIPATERGVCVGVPGARRNAGNAPGL